MSPKARRKHAVDPSQALACEQSDPSDQWRPHTSTRGRACNHQLTTGSRRVYLPLNHYPHTRPYATQQTWRNERFFLILSWARSSKRFWYRGQAIPSFAFAHFYVEWCLKGGKFNRDELFCRRNEYQGACLLFVAFSIRSRTLEYSYQRRKDSKSIGAQPGVGYPLMRA